MDIKFVIRSRFLELCEAATSRGWQVLKAGKSLRVDIAKGGYNGRVLVTIHPDDSVFFATSWRAKDPSRFPVRIRAATTALRNNGYVGRFEIGHTDGAIEIRAVQPSQIVMQPLDRSRGRRTTPVSSDRNTVYLVSCVSQKRDTPSPAKDLYVSKWFRKARAYVEASGCPWFILSAQYGLVDPDQVIATYDKTLNTMPVAERREWASRVLAQLNRAVPRLARFVVLAGKHYREFLLDSLRIRGVEVVEPLAEQRIGEQLRWLSRNTTSAFQASMEDRLMQMRGCWVPSYSLRVMYKIIMVEPGHGVTLISRSRQRPSELLWADIKRVYSGAQPAVDLTPTVVDKILDNPQNRDSSTMCALVLAMRDPSRIRRK